MASVTTETARRLLEDRRIQLTAGALAAAAGGMATARAVAARRRRGGKGEPSRAYRLRREERRGSDEGLRRIAIGRAERAAERLREARRAEDPSRCVHGARKDLKKSRAVLRLLRHELGEDFYREQNHAYRQAGRLLSHARDAEVKPRTLEAIAERYADRLPAGAADEWLAALHAERERALEAARGGDSAALGEALELVEAGRGAIDLWPLEAGGWGLVEPGLSRAYRRGRKWMRRAAADPSAANIHQWRKRVKDLWYQLRILAVATPEGLSELVDLADQLADELGEHHDLAVLRDDLLVRDLPTARRPALVAAIADRQRQLAAAALARGEALYAEKPKRFRKRMRAGWRAWSER